MSVISDIVQNVVDEALRQILRKPAAKRTRRRRRTTLTAAERLRRLERLVQPAKRQVSRKRTTRARSKVKRRVQ